MKKLLSILTLAIISGINAQVIIGDAVGTAANKTSVLLEFAAGQKKGIIVPYARTLPTGSGLVGGTILLDATDATHARVKFYNENPTPGTQGWSDLSGATNFANVTTTLADQPTIVDAPELAASKAIIGGTSSTADGVLVLESDTKAMVLPIVGTVVVTRTAGNGDSYQETTVDVPNPSPGMMVYVNTPGFKRLAVYNGSKWSFWKP